MKERAEMVKAYIEKKYQKLKSDERERKEGRPALLTFQLGTCSPRKCRSSISQKKSKKSLNKTSCTRKLN